MLTHHPCIRRPSALCVCPPSVQRSPVRIRVHQATSMGSWMCVCTTRGDQVRRSLSGDLCDEGQHRIRRVRIRPGILSEDCECVCTPVKFAVRAFAVCLHCVTVSYLFINDAFAVRVLVVRLYECVATHTYIYIYICMFVSPMTCIDRIVTDLCIMYTTHPPDGILWWHHLVA